MHVKKPPRLSNIRVEHGPREHLTLRTNIHLPCVCLKVVSSQRTPERLLVSNFDANIVDLRGELISPSTNNNAAANKLRVKVIKANHLGRGPGIC
ncbi:hypothetical protein ANCDUO_06061 [Ancylostoma duodenale]|uniref:Uncharacterized protein n=1 Tax=Ancylostoma duodenale TaxID=51022 RepID=A0A0C2H2I0_9BILA|nr:hypothetical protein ANCDUO_06061 [Ancylostoma duodenale]